MPVTIPVPVRDARNERQLTGVTQLQTSEYHTCVRHRDGRALCWGFNDAGGVGSGSQHDAVVPVVVFA
jgi:alpha-tubulin suppressor-like RCC1 family protein